MNGWLSWTGLSASDIADGMIKKSEFYADQLDFPVNADYAVNALAPVAADSNNAAFKVALFDDTTEEGLAFPIGIPAGATNIELMVIGRAETSFTQDANVGLELYGRNIPDDAAVTAWSSTTLTEMIIPGLTENFQYYTETIALSTLSLTAGEEAQFQLTRVAPGSNNLPGDFTLYKIQIDWS